MSGGLAQLSAQLSDTAAAASGITGWRWMLGLGAVPPALILLGLVWLPESPRFLGAAGRERAAVEVLHRIYGPQEAAATAAQERSAALAEAKAMLVNAHTKEVSHVAWSANGQYIATSGLDRQVVADAERFHHIGDSFPAKVHEHRVLDTHKKP